VLVRDFKNPIGNGYVGRFPDGTYIRFYVTDIASNTANIVYEYPSTSVCPAGNQIIYSSGAGGSQNGPPTNGAIGQVTISW
jgi:hypothetical protein